MTKDIGVKNSKKRRIIQITITEKCNLNCVYCYEKQKDPQFLSLKKIKEIINSAFEESNEYSEIEFDFHGGEPAMAFNVLKEACEWLWSKPRSKPYICCTTTNGTLIHGEIKDWFLKNKEKFVLGLSLDGTPEMQNINRSNSFNDIDIDFFRDNWPFQGVKMTISPQTMPMVSEGIKYIHELGFKFSANLAYGVEWKESCLSIYRNELKKIVEYYLSNPNLEINRLVNLPLCTLGYNLSFPSSVKKSKYCGAGDSMICYAPNGKSYPCQLFMPSTSVENGDKVFNKVDFSNAQNFVDPACKDCVLDTICATCCGHNYMQTNTLYTRPKDLCKYRKIEAVASSYLFASMLLEPKKYLMLKDLKEIELAYIAKAISAIQENLSDEVMSY